MLTLDSFDGCKAKCKRCKNYFEKEKSRIAPLFKIPLPAGTTKPFLCLCDPCYSRWITAIYVDTEVNFEAFINER